MRLILGLAVAATLAPSAHAGFLDGNLLARSCERQDLVSAGYIAGIMDKRGAELSFMGKELDAITDDAVTHQVAVDMQHVGAQFCIPENSDLGQLSKVFCKYLNDNPSQLHHDGDDLVTSAFRQAFPCKF